MPFVTKQRSLSQMFGSFGKYMYFCSIETLNKKNMSDFMTPPKHVNFRAKKLFGEMGNNTDGVTKMIGISVI